MKRWFELETPVDIIDAQLMRAVQSMQRPDIDVICEVLAVVDQYHRRGALDREQFKRLKGRIERHAVGGTQPAAEPARRVVREAPALVRAATRPVVSVVPPGPQIAPPPPAGIQPGTVLRDRYLVKELLGEGGMSSVFRASDRQREGLAGHDGNIAIKVLRPALTGRPEAIKALRLEFERAQRLSHPSIINVFDIDTDGDTLFITMELLRGEMLNDVIKRVTPAALQRDQALEIVHKLGLAVAYAHDQDVVHADIKPGNVMITENGELRLFDFGAAWLAQREPWI
ncbi:MAG: serine/threonine-protein kinase, partial [Steroidobacteraceae bacterium]